MEGIPLSKLSLQAVGVLVLVTTVPRLNLDTVGILILATAKECGAHFTSYLPPTFYHLTV